MNMQIPLKPRGFYKHDVWTEIIKTNKGIKKCLDYTKLVFHSLLLVNICVWKSGHVYVFDGEKYSTSLKHQYRTAFNTTPYEEVPL